MPTFERGGAHRPEIKTNRRDLLATRARSAIAADRGPVLQLQMNGIACSPEVNHTEVFGSTGEKRTGRI
jgi:hypothetical protein